MSETPSPDAGAVPLKSPVTPWAGAVPAPAPRRRRVSPRVLIAIIAAVAGLVPAIAIPVSITVQANAGYDAALDARTDAAQELQTALDHLDSITAIAADHVVIATDTLAAAADGYVGAEQRSALASARDALATAFDAAAGFDATVPTVRERPSGVSELDTAAAELTDDIPELTAALTALAPVSAHLAEQTLAVSAAGDALIATVVPNAQALLAANYSAANLVHIDYVSMLDNLPASLHWGDELAPALAGYFAAAQALQASNASEEAQKAGPFYSQRVAVEAFARSIAGGVLLDFDWAPVVNGYGGGLSYGGMSTWNTAPPGYSTMTLSNSVAGLWGVNSAVASLVAHEVGHSITSKCYDLFRTSFASQDEVWATAWAIGLGYSEGGSGESIYGRPSDEQIALSTQCR